MKCKSMFAVTLCAALTACASPETTPEQAQSKVDAQPSQTPLAAEAVASKPAKKKHEHLGIPLDSVLGKLTEFYEVSAAPAEHGRPVHMARNKRTKGVLKAFGDPKKLSEIQFTLTLDEHGLYRNDDVSVLGNAIKAAAPDWKDGEVWLRKTISSMADEPVEKSAFGVTVNVKKISIANLVVVRVF